MAWGNYGYSAGWRYLRHISRRALEAEGSILECGSGLSTLVLGLMAERRGHRVHSLEHHAGWHGHMAEILRRHSLGSVDMIHAPLRSYGHFDWYGLPASFQPDPIALAVCDGPPARTRGGRYGLMPAMRQHMRNDCRLVLDDTLRGGEQSAIQRWKAQEGMQVEALGALGNFTEIQLIA